MKKFIQKFIPQSITRKLYHSVLTRIKEKNKQKSEQIPKHNLQKRHIENAKLITDRKGLLELLPKEGILAELGVDEGSFSEVILSTCNPKKLHLIDLWGSERYNRNKRKSVENKFKQQIENGKIAINVGLSTEVVNEFQDNYFDWIYIDTSHSYETTIKELEAYRLKIKDNGIIAGHDYIIGNWNGMVRYGVIEAVSEFCIKYDWEIIYLTVELDNHPSFAIKKINVANKK